MSKKVEKTVSAVELAPANADNKNLYVQVTTYATDGKVVGTRIVDMYHFGTRNWLHNHCWWAMHNGHSVNTEIAHPDDVTAYLAEGAKRLADKFNSKPAAAVAA